MCAHTATLTRHCRAVALRRGCPCGAQPSTEMITELFEGDEQRPGRLAWPSIRGGEAYALTPWPGGATLGCHSSSAGLYLQFRSLELLGVDEEGVPGRPFRLEAM